MQPGTNAGKDLPSLSMSFLFGASSFVCSGDESPSMFVSIDHDLQLPQQSVRPHQEVVLVVSRYCESFCDHGLTLVLDESDPLDAPYRWTFTTFIHTDRGGCFIGVSFLIRLVIVVLV